MAKLHSGGVRGKKAPSKHSRAARRETSPSINTDKSLKEIQLPQQTIEKRPSVLAAQYASGVHKPRSSRRKQVLSSRARKRKEKGMDQAEAIRERTANKVKRSKRQARTIQSRNRAWDKINGQIPQRDVAASHATQSGGGLFGTGNDGDASLTAVDGDEEMGEPLCDADGDMEVVVGPECGDGVELAHVPSAVTPEPTTAGCLPGTDDGSHDDDEIL